MAAAAGRALLGSMTTKTARAPPRHRLHAARRLHDAGPGRSSPSPSSPPPPTGNEDLARNMKIPPELDCSKSQFKRNTANAACILGLSGLLVHYWVLPKLDALEDRIDALSGERAKLKAKLKDDIIQIIKEEFERVHIEVKQYKAKIPEAPSMHNSAGGHGKEPAGHNASDDLDEA